MTAVISNGELSFKMRLDQAIKLVCIICLNMTVYALMVARNSPAIAYEPSIYTSTPFIVWLVLFINLVCGIGIVVNQVGSNRHTKNNSWLLGIWLVVISYTIMLSLWIIRGYAQWGEGDPFNHLKTVYNLILNSHIYIQYPIAHILLAQLSFLCDVSPIMFLNTVPFLFGIFYLFFMYLFAKSIFTNKGQIILTMLVSMTFMLSSSYLQFTPNRLANLTLPLALSIIINSFDSGTSRWKILLVIMILFFPPFHSIVAFLIVFTLLTMWLVNRLPLIKESKLSKYKSFLRLDYTAVTLSIVWMIFWVLPFQNWVELYMHGESTSLTPPVTNRSFNDYLFIQIPFWLKSFGGTLLCIFFAMSAIPILIKKIRLHPELLKLFSLYGPMILSVFLTVGFFFLRMGYDFFFRLQTYTIIIGTLFGGFVIYELLEQAYQKTYTHRAKIVSFIVIVFLLSLSLFGFSILYESPFTYNNNFQVTRTEIDGMDWFLHSKNTTKLTTGISIPPGQFAKILITPGEQTDLAETKLNRGMIRQDIRMPSHFGYDNYSNMGDFYPNVYLALSSRDKQLYQGPHNELTESVKFLPQDFKRINYDNTVDYIYSNGGLDVYFIRSTNMSMQV